MQSFSNFHEINRAFRELVCFLLFISVLLKSISRIGIAEESDLPNLL
jgi:hypothetical protein